MQRGLQLQELMRAETVLTVHVMDVEARPDWATGHMLEDDTMKIPLAVWARVQARVAFFIDVETAEDRVGTGCHVLNTRDEGRASRRRNQHDPSYTPTEMIVKQMGNEVKEPRGIFRSTSDPTSLRGCQRDSGSRRQLGDNERQHSTEKP